ncbi:MAG TPA: DUF6603 domain-containing protein, partial [Thermoanaerobaculia bacterium]|nr:DUF6603 domain-containing protein [Thermoanaerobaculia bacterium]
LMPLTYSELVALLTPQPDGSLTLHGRALETQNVTVLFDAYFAAGTMVVQSAASVSDSSTSTVTVSGPLASDTFLNLTHGALTRGTFTLTAGGTVNVVLDVRVDDEHWRLPHSFPTIVDTVFDELTYANPAFTLDSASPAPFPQNFRRNFNYPPDLPDVAGHLISGLSFRADTEFTGYLDFLREMIQPPIAVSGPIESFLQVAIETERLDVMPQLVLSTPASGLTQRVGDYSFTFSVQMGCLFQEFEAAEDLPAAVIPTSVIAVRTELQPEGFSAIPVSMYVFGDNQGTLIFNVGEPSSVEIGKQSLPLFLNGASPGSMLEPPGFPDYEEMMVVGVSLTMETDPLTLTSISLAAAIGRNKNWTLFDGLLTIDEITFLIGSTAGSGASWEATASIEGKGWLRNNFGADLYLTTSVMLSTQTLSFDATLQQFGTLDLTSIVEPLIGNPFDSAITSSLFTMSGDAGLDFYRFETIVDQQWVLFGSATNGLVLTEVGLTLGSDAGVAFGGVWGNLNLGGAPVHLSANYVQDGGWSFAGSTIPGQSIDLVQLFAQLTSLFGLTLPPDLPRILLDELRVTFETATEVLSIDASLSVPDATYNLADIPFIGRALDPSDRITLERITIAIRTGGGNPSIVDFGFVVGFGTNDRATIVIPLAGSPETPVQPPANAPATYPPDGSGAWVPAQRSFGPLLVEKLGFLLNEDGLGVRYNASLAVSGMLLEVIGMRMLARLTEPYVPEFGIDGVAASYASPSLTFGGALLRVPNPDYFQFDGAVVVKAKKYGTSALASYATSEPPSMFVFALVNVPVGGPPAFFINGFSGGFGFNRQLTLPSLAEVPTYPLIAGASISTNPFGPDPTIGDFVGQMSGRMPVAIGQYWAAAGIAAETFGTLQSQLLMTVAFGTRFQIGIIGLSTLAIPPDVDKPVARAQLAMEAVFLPDDGFMGISAQLTPSSYVFEPECVLSGGFAYFLWFSPNENSGDFVVTLGGYSPYYNKPAHYPAVPILGMNWNVADSPLVLKGGAYLALMPRAVMTGGYLNGTWSSDSLKVWFAINADFLIQWKPFHYDLRAGVTFGIQATFRLGVARVTLSVTLGAELALWGPPFSGKATLNLSVITFTVAFGSEQRQTPPPIGWEEFKQSFLPASIAPAVRAT